MALIINPITADNFISQIEQSGNIAVSGMVSGAFRLNDVVSLRINGVPYTGNVGADGSFVILVSGVDLALDADKTIEASFDGHDTAGNLVVQTANWTYDADTGGPTAATTTIVLNAVTADNFVTLAEGQTNVTLTGKVTGIYKPGDTVTLLINGTKYFGVISGRGDFSIVVNGSDLLADGDKTVDASVDAHNAANVVGVVTGVKPYTVEVPPTIKTVEPGAPGAGDDSVTEGTPLVYTVTLSSPSSTPTEFSYSLGGGTASPTDYTSVSFSNGVTYNPATGKITVPAGVTSFTVTLPTVDDNITEATETVPLVIGGVTGTGSILDNETAPTIKTVEPGAPGAGDDSVTEGTPLVYTVTLSSPSSTPTEFSYSLGGGTASPTDYTSVSFSNGVTYNPATGKITVPAGVTSFTVTLPTVDDNITEATETVPLVIGGVTGTGSILDNETAPTIKTVEPGAPGAGDDSVTEGTPLVYTVTLSSPSSTPTEFSYSLGGGTASPTDYTSVSFSNGVTYNPATGKITVPAGVTSFTVTLPTVDDNITEATETVPLVIGGVTGTGSILDNETAPTIKTVEPGAPGAGDDSVTEGTPLVYTVTLSSPSSTPTEFSYSLGGGTASPTDYTSVSFSNGVTYNPATGKITVPAGVTSFTVTLPTVDDNITEATETVPLVIGGVTGTGSILDNETAPTIKTVEPGAPGAGDDSVTEGTPLVYTVTLSNPSSTPTEFTYTLGGGTASPADYTSVSFSNGVTYNAATGKITVPAGVTSFTVTLPTVDDTLFEATETVPLVIGGVTGTGSIRDNETAPTIKTVEPGAPGAGDDSVVEGTPLVYTVTLSNPSSTPTEFSYSLGGGTASPADYTSVSFSNGVTYNAATGKITVPAGVTSFTVTLPTVDDTLFEATETVPLVIGGVTGTGSIRDNETAPTIKTVEPGAPGAGDDSVVEGTPLVYTVTLSNPSSTPTEFSYSLGGGTASPADYTSVSFSNGVTYNAATGKITVPAGVTSFTVTLPTVDDNITEATETVPLVIGGVTGTGSILDNETAPTIKTVEPGAPGAGDDSVTEGTPLVYTVTLSSPSSTPTEFSYSLGGGTASPTDYTSVSFSNGVTYNPATGKITVPAGVTSFTVTLPTVDDTLFEATETVPLVIGGVTGTGSIRDNETAPTIKTVEPGAPGAGDDSVVEGTPLVYTVTLSNPSSTPTEFSYSLGGGTASPADYTSVSFSNGVTYNAATGKITVPAGVTSFTVTLPTVDDTLFEATETVPLVIGGVTGTGSIRDNDSAPNLVSLTRFSDGNEDGTSSPSWTLTMSNTSSTATNAMLFFRDSEDGTATYGQDFTGVVRVYSLDGTLLQTVTVGNADVSSAFGAISIPAGMLSVRLVAEPKDDNIFEGDETIKIWAQVGNNSLWSETAIIHDNESTPTIKTVEPGAPGAGDDSVVEGTPLVYTVTLSNSSSTPTEFSYTLGGGTASPADYGTVSFSNGVTYNPATGKITVPAGVTSFTVTLPTVDDNITEATETVPLVIGGVTGTGSIRDNDTAPTIKTVEPGAPGAGDDSVVEGTPLVYTVTLSNPSSTPTEFSYSLGGGTASPADYTSVSFSNGVTYNPATGKITVPAGVTSFTVTLPTVDDTLFEATETVPLVIGGVTGTGSILDNDTAPLDLHGMAKGVEDTPLILNWDSFKLGDVAATATSIMVSSLPVLGHLEVLNSANVWVAVSTSQTISKDDIDAGHLRFVPNANESGEDRYIQPGVGNKLNDYAAFDYKVNQGATRLAGGGHFTVDIEPIAETIAASYGTPNNAGNGPMIHWLQPTSSPFSNNGSGWISYENYNYMIWTKLPINLTPTPDTDGSERIMIQLKGVSFATVQNSLGATVVIGEINQNSEYTDLQNAKWAVQGTSDYYKAADGSFWINSSLLSTVSIPSFNQDNSGTFFNTYDNSWHITQGTHAYTGYSVNVIIHDQEINSAGTVLNEKILDLGNKELHGTYSEPYYNSWTPLVLDLNGDGVHTLGAEHGVMFDAFGHGAIGTGWVDKHDGLLALDLNHDDKINNGAELFGEATRLADGGLAKNGFEALAQYDGNRDGKIDAQDSIFAQLQVWVDANSDGLTQDGELRSLAQAGVASISLASTESNATDNGNTFGLTGNYTGADGANHEMVDVWFAAEQTLDALLDQAGLPTEAAAPSPEKTATVDAPATTEALRHDMMLDELQHAVVM